jgi:ATP-dependent exoDNAse (exonuclease V) alpha subunit
MIHADSGATNLVDQKMLYVAVSRARSSAVVYTDDRDRLVTGIKERAGEKQVALETALPALAVAKSAGAGLG